MKLAVVINMMKLIHAQVTWVAPLLYHWLCWIGIGQDWSSIKICFTSVLSPLVFFPLFFWEIRNSEKDALHFTYHAKERGKYESRLNFSMLQDFFQNYRVFEMGPVRAIQKTIYWNGKTMFNFSQWNVWKILKLHADLLRCSFRDSDTCPMPKLQTTTRTAYFTFLED